MKLKGLTMSTVIDRPRPVNLNEPQAAYDPIARTLHWLVFILLAVQVAVG